jgi:hypothetical protein
MEFLMKHHNTDKLLFNPKAAHEQAQLLHLWVIHNLQLP